MITAGWTRVINSKTLLETRVGGIYVRKDYVPNSGDYVTPGHIDIETGISSVNRTSAAARDNQNKMNINVTLSHAATDFIKGTHDFKFGVQTTPWNSSTYRGAFASDLLLYDLGSAPYSAEPGTVCARRQDADLRRLRAGRLDRQQPPEPEPRPALRAHHRRRCRRWSS